MKNIKIKNSLIAAGILAVPSAVALGIYFGTKKPKAVWSPTKDFLALKTSDVDIVNNIMSVRGGTNLVNLISVNNLTTGYKGAKKLISKGQDGGLKIISKYNINLSELNNSANLDNEYLKINKEINKELALNKSKNLNYGIYAIKDINKNKFIVELVEVNTLSESQLKIANDFAKDLGEMIIPKNHDHLEKWFPKFFMAEHFGSADISDDYIFNFGVTNFTTDNINYNDEWKRKRKLFEDKYGEKWVYSNIFNKEHMDSELYPGIKGSNAIFNKYSHARNNIDENSYDLWTKIIPKKPYNIERSMVRIKIINPEDFPTLDNYVNYNKADKIIGMNSGMNSKVIYNKKLNDKNTYYTLPNPAYLKSDRNDPLMSILKGIKKDSFNKNKKLVLEIQLVDQSKIPAKNQFIDKKSLVSTNIDTNYIQKTERIEIALDNIPDNWDDAGSINFDQIISSQNFKIDLKWFKHNFWDKDDKMNFSGEVLTEKLLKENLAVRFVPALDMRSKKFTLNIQFYDIGDSNNLASIETDGTGKLLNPSAAVNIASKDFDLSNLGNVDKPTDMSKAKKIIKKFLTQDLPRYHGEPLIEPGLNLMGKMTPAINTLLQPFIHAMRLMSKDFGLLSKEGIKDTNKNGYKLSFEVDKNGKRIQDWHKFKYQDIFKGKDGDVFLEELINKMSDSNLINLNKSLAILENFERDSFNSDSTKNHWTSLDWLTDLDRKGHYDLYSLLSVFDNISGLINDKILKTYPEANFEIIHDKQVDKLILFLKQNRVVGNNFSINDIINNPIAQMASILLEISEKNLQIPIEMIKSIMDVIPVPLISENKDGFLDLINYLFEKRSYRQSKYTNLRILSQIFGRSKEEKAENIKLLISDTDNLIPNLFSLLNNLNLNNDQIDIVANIIAKLPMLNGSTKETVKKLVPFIKSVLPSAIDLISNVSNEGFKCIFDPVIPDGIDINMVGKFDNSAKKALFSYFNNINKNHPEYFKSFLNNNESLKEYADSITSINDLKLKSFSEFELFLSTLVYEFIDKGADKFDSTINLIIKLLKPEFPKLIKTLNQVFVEGPFNHGEYSLRKFAKELSGLGIFSTLLPKNIKPILDLFLGGGNNNLFSLMWDSIDKGIGIAIKEIKAKEDGDQNIHTFFENIFKLLAPSGYIRGEASTDNAISNSDGQKLLQGFLEGFNSKDNFSGSIIKLISKELLDKNILTNKKFSDFLTNTFGQIYEQGKYASANKTTLMPNIQKLLTTGLISLSDVELKSALSEIKALASSLKPVANFDNDVKDVLEKIELISGKDIKNIADTLYALLNTGINSINAQGINSLINLLKTFGVLDKIDIPNIGESIVKLLKSGVSNTKGNDIEKLLKIIAGMVPIPGIVNSLLDFVVKGWDVKDKSLTKQAMRIYVA